MLMSEESPITINATKDGSTGRWPSWIRVTDWTGKVIHNHQYHRLDWWYLRVKKVAKPYV